MTQTPRNNLRVVVVSGGQPISRAAASYVDDTALVVAADSGWDRARECGLAPHVLVGDMDSISHESLREAEHGGATIVRHPVDKDYTDLELALAHASTRGSHVMLLSGGGGRLDHALAELVALTSPALTGCEVDAIIGSARVHVVHAGQTRHIDAPADTTMSLLVVGEPARGVTVTGCKWELIDAELTPHESRGVSNVVVAPPATVTVTHGCVLVIEPFHLSGSPDEHTTIRDRTERNS